MASITTKTGDRGESGLLGGARAKKIDARFDALGALDELNAALGLAKAFAAGEDKGGLEALQAQLLALGAEVATLKRDFKRYQGKFLRDEVVEALHAEIKKREERKNFTKFVLPGSNPASAALHLARTIARRAERECWRLSSRRLLVRELPCLYLNRLSDLLWLMAETD